MDYFFVLKLFPGPYFGPPDFRDPLLEKMRPRFPYWGGGPRVFK